MENIGFKFIEYTKYQYAGPSDQEKGLLKPADEPDLREMEQIKLEDMLSKKHGDISLIEAIEKRRSVRKYSEEPLKLEELAFLLQCTQGISKIKGDKIYKNVPSAGARHALDTYLLINGVEGLKKGLYRYFSSTHALVLVDDSEDIREKIVGASKGYNFVGDGAVTFIWVAHICRMTYRHGERGYRFIFLDAGHICQNLYLAGEAINCGVCAVAVYDDDLLNGALGIDGKAKFAVYMAAVGNKVQDKPVR